MSGSRTRPEAPYGSPRWKDPVPTAGGLPVGGNTIGDIRTALDTGKGYFWNGSSWQDYTGVVGAISYQGTWNASTNTPALADGTGTKGHYYVVSVGGSQDLGSGLIVFTPSDWVVHNGSIWEKADHTDFVFSVFTRVGAVIAAPSDYDASQVDNDSGVAGAFVKDALDTLDSGKEDAFAKNTAFNKDFGISPGDVPEIGAALGNSEIVETEGSGKLDSVAKGTSYNKNFGGGSGTVCEGDDSRIPIQGENDALVGTSGTPSTSNKYVTNVDSRNSDARAPTNHAGNHEGGGDPVSPGGIGAEVAFAKNTAFNKDFGINPGDVPGIAAALGNSEIVETDGFGELDSVAKGTAYNKAFGSGSGDVCEGDDARLSDARTPTVHSTSPAAGGSDPLPEIPTWEKYTVGYAALAFAGLTNDIELFSLIAAGVIHAIKVKHSETFIGGAISAYTISVGIVGTLAKYHSAFDAFQAIGNTVQSVEDNIGTENHGAVTSIRIAAISTGANLDQATQGSVDIWVLKSKAV